MKSIKWRYFIVLVAAFNAFPNNLEISLTSQIGATWTSWESSPGKRENLLQFPIGLTAWSLIGNNLLLSDVLLADIESSQTTFKSNKQKSWQLQNELYIGSKFGIPLQAFIGFCNGIVFGSHSYYGPIARAVYTIPIMDKITIDLDGAWFIKDFYNGRKIGSEFVKISPRIVYLNRQFIFLTSYTLENRYGYIIKRFDNSLKIGFGYFFKAGGGKEH